MDLSRILCHPKDERSDQIKESKHTASNILATMEGQSIPSLLEENDHTRYGTEQLKDSSSDRKRVEKQQSLYQHGQPKLSKPVNRIAHESQMVKLEHLMDEKIGRASRTIKSEYAVKSNANDAERRYQFSDTRQSREIYRISTASSSSKRNRLEDASHNSKVKPKYTYKTTDLDENIGRTQKASFAGPRLTSIVPPSPYSEFTVKNDLMCTIAECTRPALSGQLCSFHGGGSRCEVPDCGKLVVSRQRCRRHGGELDTILSSLCTPLLTANRRRS